MNFYATEWVDIQKVRLIVQFSNILFCKRILENMFEINCI